MWEKGDKPGPRVRSLQVYALTTRAGQTRSQGRVCHNCGDCGTHVAFGQLGRNDLIRSVVYGLGLLLSQGLEPT